MSAATANRAAALSALREIAAEARELQAAAGGSVTETVAAWLAPHYLLAARDKLSGATGADRFDVLRTFVQDWTLLRRGDQAAARRADKHVEFREWIKRPEVLAELFPDRKAGLSAETIAKIERELKLL
jgi:hypothetical protein